MTSLALIARALVTRPESLCLSGSQGLPARVVEERFTGALSYVVVELDGGSRVQVLLDGDAPNIGDSVRIDRRTDGPMPTVFDAGDAL